MFEDTTYESILQGMLNKVPRDIDKREGSIVYNALAPVAVELQNLYIAFDVVLKEAFASTAEGGFLEKRAFEMGIERQPATKAKKKGCFYSTADILMDIPMGSRFSLEDLNYTAVSKISDGTYVMECETAGAVGNGITGNLIPINYIEGLARTALGESIEVGMDQESDEKLLERYQLKVQRPTTSGNIYHYQQWALDVTGVGIAKVFGLWDGPGTVKVVIADSDRHPASTKLVDAVSKHIESVRPIGAKVAVLSASGKTISVVASVTLAAGYTLQSVQSTFAEALGKYLLEIAFEMTYVSLAQIGTLLIRVPGVLDYNDLKLNGSNVNIPLANEEIPVMGTVELEVL